MSLMVAVHEYITSKRIFNVYLIFILIAGKYLSVKGSGYWGFFLVEFLLVIRRNSVL